MRLIVSVYAREGFPPESKLAGLGDPLSFSIASDYLVAAGQTMDIGVSVFDADAMVLAQAGPREDARHLNLVQMPANWDVSSIPTTRLLATILEDVVQHGIENPEHGVNCACMDKAAHEIRLQLSKAIPPDGRTTDTDWAQPIHDRVNAKARIRHVLDMVLRGF